MLPTNHSACFHLPAHSKHPLVFLFRLSRHPPSYALPPRHLLRHSTSQSVLHTERPISLLSTIGKLTESIILHRLKNFINENNILNPNQYGFTNKLSTLHPLLRLTENISEGFQKKKSTRAVFLDIQKAFDRVWINGLTFKLITFNIPHPLIHLIHSYLTNRSFRIRINETLSNEHSVSAGCPQGSLLGPLLFNLYINHIPDYSITKINLYADDTAIHQRPKIPPLNSATGTAVTDQQKANVLATNIKNNFVENDREDDNYNQNDELINTTVNNFLSTPPNSFIEPALPDEIIHYIKHVNA
ncbi:probable RNA-directed DNA polymerase from transposon X-element [Trichonephila clavipes]|nr:probable RNA-directed DNA polymerase from transposon X-element [Trichonephila clavipes]